MSTFSFRNFKIIQSNTPAKVGTDALLLAAWADVDNASSVLDIGSGTGVIALLLAQRSPASNIIALEPEPGSFNDACENFFNSPFTGQIKCINLSLQDYAVDTSAGRFDLIISNPPFFDSGALSENHQRNYWRHTLSLPFLELLGGIEKLLSPKGKFTLILPLVEGKKFISHAYKHKFYLDRYALISPMNDAQPNRLLVSFSRRLQPVIRQSIILYQDKVQTRTKQFQDLVAPFLLG